MKTISKDQRIINILSRAIECGFEFNLSFPLGVNVESAEETLIEEYDYDRIEVIECDRSYSHFSYDDGMGYHVEYDGELINSGDNRDKNHYYERQYDGSWSDTRIIEHNPGDIIYVLVANLVDSEALVVALVAKYTV